MMKFFEILTTITGIGMSVSYFPQAYRIYKNKSSRDVSTASYVLFCIGTTVWFAYGVVKKDWIIALGYVFGVIGSWLVLSLIVRYQGKSPAPALTDNSQQ